MTDESSIFQRRMRLRGTDDVCLLKQAGLLWPWHSYLTPGTETPVLRSSSCCSPCCFGSWSCSLFNDESNMQSFGWAWAALSTNDCVMYFIFSKGLINPSGISGKKKKRENWQMTVRFRLHTETDFSYLGGVEESWLNGFSDSICYGFFFIPESVIWIQNTPERTQE